MRAEGFFYNLDILYGGCGIGKLQFLIKKNKKNFPAVIFFQFLVIKPLDPDWIRIGLQPQTLDPDPEKLIRIHNPGNNSWFSIGVFCTVSALTLFIDFKINVDR